MYEQILYISSKFAGMNILKWKSNVTKCTDIIFRFPILFQSLYSPTFIFQFFQ